MIPGYEPSPEPGVEWAVIRTTCEGFEACTRTYLPFPCQFLSKNGGQAPVRGSRGTGLGMVALARDGGYSEPRWVVAPPTIQKRLE